MDDLSLRTPRLDPADQVLFVKQSVCNNLNRARLISLLLMLQSLLYLLIAYMVYGAAEVNQTLVAVVGSLKMVLAVLFGTPALIVLLAQGHPGSRHVQWLILMITIAYGVVLSLVADDLIYIYFTILLLSVLISLSKVELVILMLLATLLMVSVVLLSGGWGGDAILAVADICILSIVALLISHVMRVQRLNRFMREQVIETQNRDLERANRELARLSALDGLTSLANRRSFDEHLGQEWQRARRSGVVLSLLMIDVDLFKKYNDAYGHLAGDDCLRKVAGALQQEIRRPADLLARYGGEEFCVILPETELRGALTMAENLCSAVRRLQIRHQLSAWGHVTVSIGAASLQADAGADPQALIEAADAALYRAKSAGRNRVAD